MHVDLLITHQYSAHSLAAECWWFYSATRFSQALPCFVKEPDVLGASRRDVPCCSSLQVVSNRAPKHCPHLYPFLLFQFQSSQHLISKASQVSPDKTRSQLLSWIANTYTVLITSGHISSGALCLGGLHLSTGRVTRNTCLRFHSLWPAVAQLLTSYCSSWILYPLSTLELLGFF